MRNYNLLLILISAFTLFGCKTDNVDGIIINDTLYVHQSFIENNRMKKLIKKSLKNDKEAILGLISFPNGGAAGSYDLGYVITQIIYRIGEDDFINLIGNISKKKLNNLQGLIRVGLEYGDNDYNNIMDNMKIENQFPKIKTFIDAKL